MEWLFTTALLPCHEKLRFDQLKPVVVISGVITNCRDMDDYPIMKWGLHRISEKFPHFEVSMAAEVVDLYSYRSYFPATIFPRYIWGNTAHSSCDTRYGYSSDKDKRVMKQCKRFIKEKAQLVIEMPHPDCTNTAGHVVSRKDCNGDVIATSKRFIRIKDYSANFDPYLRALFSFGLSPFDLGIIHVAIPTSDLSSLRDSALKNLLLQGSTHEEYHQTHNLYLGSEYSDRSKNLKFIGCSLKHAQKCDKPFIDILVQGVPPDRIDDFCAQLIVVFPTIKQVTIIDKTTNTMAQKILREEGMTLQIINPFPLEEGDRLQLISNASGSVFCKGNFGISEVLSAGKLPLLMSLDDYRFFTNLLSLVQEISDEGMPSEGMPQLIQYLKLMETMDPSSLNTEAISSLGSDPRTQEQWLFLRDYLRKYYNGNEIFTDLISMRLALQTPALQKKYSELFREFRIGSKTLRACQDEYQACLTHLIQ